MVQPTEHLTAIPAATLIAWHTSEDIQAVRMDDGSERLYVDGLCVPLTAEHHSPTQQVINYCRLPKRQKAWVRLSWLAKAGS